MGFFAVGLCMNFVMLQGYLLQEFVKHLLPQIDIVAIRVVRLLDYLQSSFSSRYSFMNCFSVRFLNAYLL